MDCPAPKGCFFRARFGWLTAGICMGRKKEARELFERLLELRNDLGLLSEEYDPRAKRQLGNFPQAFSHVALVVAPELLEPTRTDCPIARRLNLRLARRNEPPNQDPQ